MRLVRDEHPVPAAPEYAFGDSDEAIPDAVQTLDLGDADAAGHVAIDAAVAIPGGVGSPLRAVLSAGLAEPGGRSVTETLSVPVHHPLLLGIRKLFGERVDSGSSAGFAIRAFGPDGVPVARSGLGWRLLRIDRRWDWWRGRSGDGRWTFHYRTEENEVARGTLDVAAGGPASLARTLEWGDYKLVVFDDPSGAASSARFSVGWGAASAAADVPDRIEVAADRAVAGMGQTARVRLRGPFAGPAQIVVESAGRVLSTQRIDLPRDGATVDLVASESWGAGVHVLAEAFRPLDKPAGAHRRCLGRAARQHAPPRRHRPRCCHAHPVPCLRPASGRAARAGPAGRDAPGLRARARQGAGASGAARHVPAWRCRSRLQSGHAY